MVVVAVLLGDLFICLDYFPSLAQALEASTFTFAYWEVTESEDLLLTPMGPGRASILHSFFQAHLLPSHPWAFSLYPFPTHSDSSILGKEEVTQRGDVNHLYRDLSGLGSNRFSRNPLSSLMNGASCFSSLRQADFFLVPLTWSGKLLPGGEY